MEILYHASPVPNIKTLTPHTSNHEIPQTYFSTRRENVLLYLSNSIEKYCKETGFKHTGKWQKWGPYGFTKDGKLNLEEYYPNALEETYRGVSGYIYSAAKNKDMTPMSDIPNGFVSQKNVEVLGYEIIKDAYTELLKAEKEGIIKITRYAEQTKKHKEWIKNTILEIYHTTNAPDFKHFIEGKFDFLLKNK